MSTTSMGVLYWHSVVKPTMSLKYTVTSSYSSGSTTPVSFKLFTTGLRREKNTRSSWDSGWMDLIS